MPKAPRKRGFLFVAQWPFRCDGRTWKTPPQLGFHGMPGAGTAQSPRVSRLALPPAAVVLTVTVFSVAKRGR